MKKRFIRPLVSVVVAAVFIFSTTVILAGEEDGQPSGVDKMSSKVADILGLDDTVVDDAIKQARRELWNEAYQATLTAYQEKLNAMVVQGALTREQADERLEAFQSKPGPAAVWKKKVAVNRATFQEKLNAMVVQGALTREQADEKVQ